MQGIYRGFASRLVHQQEAPVQGVTTYADSRTLTEVYMITCRLSSCKTGMFNVHLLIIHERGCSRMERKKQKGYLPILAFTAKHYIPGFCFFGMYLFLCGTQFSSPGTDSILMTQGRNYAGPKRLRAETIRFLIQRPPRQLLDSFTTSDTCNTIIKLIIIIIISLYFRRITNLAWMPVFHLVLRSTQTLIIIRLILFISLFFINFDFC